MTPLAGRVAVLGSPGSGKSTFCHGLAGAGIPLFHLDDLYWHPGWRRTPPDEWRRTVAELADGDRWIVDGNHLDTVPERLARAEIVVLLDLPVLVCAWQVVRRSRRLRRGGGRGGGGGEYLPRRLRAGDPPVRDLTALLRKVLGFRRRELVELRRLLAGYDGRIVVCRSRRAARRAQRELTALLRARAGAVGPPPEQTPCTCGGPDGAVVPLSLEDR
ncbi:hypothetical protein IAG44_17650 [Streptomyces roseirectus]|uniref:Topology modulation protein n=1 Tax=Streptomyces roseirectus TaxID=2768066 RepID=A0A7H0IE65_9ACTN|nr:hypothetical protein [Streptomyces roseirectus]QNP71081.1 hypothetical protein IAG44_17650 [Streptomyces roseirectus]